MPFKGVMIAPGDYTWKHVLMYVPTTESKRSVGVCLCVFLPSPMCARGLCVSMHMDVFPFCSCLLFLAERSQMTKADKFKEVEKISQIEPARTTNRAILLSLVQQLTCI